MQQLERRVVKLGGSLLDCADLVERWKAWIAVQSPAQTLLVVGGGGLVDVIGELQRLHSQLTDQDAHWLAIRAMQLNAEMIVGLLPEAEYVADVTGFVSRPRAAGLFIVDPWSFMQADARSESPLAATWEVSSDSIAARLAVMLGAEELVLLKSALPVDVRDLGDYVDAAFEETSRSLKAIRFVNLRDAAFAETRAKK
ncbi:MAG: hypothetical protein C0483_16770 [Pirellula sp.]|nr:hypothetical protein [Pirellula sp.]